MVRSRSVNTHPSIADRNSVCSQQCGHNKEEKEKLLKMCNDYKARKVLLRRALWLSFLVQLAYCR